MNRLRRPRLRGPPRRNAGTGNLEPALDRRRPQRPAILPVCPEVLGGLPTPRPPAERQPDGRVVTREGVDVTAEYRAGAERVLELARAHGCTLAVLKERSPSCGRGQIYDGTFSHTLIPGSGVAAQLLETQGIPVYGESRLDELIGQLSAEG